MTMTDLEELIILCKLSNKLLSFTHKVDGSLYLYDFITRSLLLVVESGDCVSYTFTFNDAILDAEYLQDHYENFKISDFL